MKKITTLILAFVFCSIFNNKIYADISYSPSGNKIINNNNYALVINEKNNLYEFYLDYLGDWSIKVNNQNELNNIEKTYKELGEYKVKNFKVSKIYYSPSGNKIIEFNDYSSLVINDTTKIYEFYPTELGDWHVNVKNKTELQNVIKTYMDYKYNMNEQQQNNISNNL